MSRKNLFVVMALMLALVLAATMFAAGCGEKKDEPEENGAKETLLPTIREGKLILGSDTTYPPYESIGEDGEPEGFDIDIAVEVAKRLELELEIKSVKWEGIIPGLKADEYDIIMSAMTITDERLEEIDFSSPYIDSDQSIAVQEENEDIEGEDDLAGKVVGVQVDTTGQFYAEGLGGIKEIRKYDTILLAFQDLELGRIDAILNDFPVNAFISKTRGGTRVVTTIATDEQYGIGIKKGNDELRYAINAALADMKADGAYDEIFERWFGAAE